MRAETKLPQLLRFYGCNFTGSGKYSVQGRDLFCDFRNSLDITTWSCLFSAGSLHAHTWCSFSSGCLQKLHKPPLHMILKRFSLLFVTALLHSGLTLGSLPCAPGLGGVLVHPEMSLRFRYSLPYFFLSHLLIRRHIPNWINSTVGTKHITGLCAWFLPVC